MKKYHILRSDEQGLYVSGCQNKSVFFGSQDEALTFTSSDKILEWVDQNDIPRSWLSTVNYLLDDKTLIHGSDLLINPDDFIHKNLIWVISVHTDGYENEYVESFKNDILKLTKDITSACIFNSYEDGYKILSQFKENHLLITKDTFVVYKRPKDLV